MQNAQIKGVLAVMLAVGIVAIVASNIFLSGIAAAVFSVVGGLVIIVAGIGLIFSSLYVKARGNLAYLKTGKGGAKVIMNDGAIIIGFLHELIPVSLETMKIVVQRAGKGQSLITLDKLRASITAEFFVRVKADVDGITTAARTLGDKISAKVAAHRGDDFLEAQRQAVLGLIEEKLVDALRTVAATQTLLDLNLKRDEFKKEVVRVVTAGLEQNGLELEDVTISNLDMASKSELDENNIFDAEGLQNLEQATAAARVKANQARRDAELQIKEKDVETESAVLEQDQALSFKKADQAREVRAYEADQDKQARIAEIQAAEEQGKRDIEKERTLELEGVKKAQAIQTAQVEREKAIQTAEVDQEKAVQTAQVDREKAVEVANRDREIAIALKESERAAADEKRNEAEAAAETARQKVETVKVTETAKRDKEKAVIAQQAESERQFVEESRKADAQAYATEKQAEGRKQAAEADYVAKTKAAEADQKAAEAKAAGERANAMVPVDVSAKQVEVDRDRVENVLKPELEAKAKHQEISVALTLGEKQIAAGQAIGVEFAKSIGVMMSAAEMNIFGDPKTLAEMTEGFSKGMGIGQIMEGFVSSEAGKGIMGMAGQLAKKAGVDLAGDSPKPEQGPEVSPETEA